MSESRVRKLMWVASIGICLLFADGVYTALTWSLGEPHRTVGLTAAGVGALLIVGALGPIQIRLWRSRRHRGT